MIEAPSPRSAYCPACFDVAVADWMFRDTSESIQQQPVARQVASPTPAEAAEPSPAPPTATEEPAPTEQEADPFALTATA